LRDNPLVVRFVQDMTLHPPTLLELAGRAVKIAGFQLEMGDLPKSLMDYLSCANCCVNPNCEGNELSFFFQDGLIIIVVTTFSSLLR
jgi:hypothetical protein